jgi:hypothetical protein
MDHIVVSIAQGSCRFDSTTEQLQFGKGSGIVELLLHMFCFTPKDVTLGVLRGKSEGRVAWSV